MEERVHEAAEKFGIRPILEKYPYQISGGQKQRTSACRAILSKPSLILRMKPTGALDSKSATDLLESLKDLSEQDRATILMVTHDPFAASYCRRVLFIKDGKLFTELVKGKEPRKEFFNKGSMCWRRSGVDIVTLLELAMKNIKGNVSRYLVYFVSLVFSMVIYFTFVSLQYNQTFQDSIELSDTMSFMFLVSSFILLVFSAIFVFYSNLFLRGSEKRNWIVCHARLVNKKTIAK